MKQLLYLIVLLTGVVNAQIVNIPDANFKAKLLSASSSNFVAAGVNGGYVKIDTNNDGEIQLSEATSINFLDVSNSNISDLTGISSFTNLQQLNLSNNQISTFDVNTFSNMQSFTCYNNNISNMNIHGLTQLSSFNLSFNNLQSLTLNNLPSLQSITINGVSLTTIDLGNITSLLSMSLSTTGTAVIQNLDLSQNHNFSSFIAGGSFKVGTLNLSNTKIHANLLDGNTINTLNVSNCTTLNNLTASACNMQNIILTGCTAITNLDVSFNNISVLDVSTLNNLQNLDCTSNNIQILDVSNNHLLGSLNCPSYNLKYLYAKNGISTSFNDTLFSSVGNPTPLIYACLDESEVAAAIQSLPANSTTVINSYCSFVPGGTYNTITGNVIFDVNNNGCDITDDIQPNIRVTINDGTTQGASYTSNSSTYTFYTQAGSFDIAPSIENPTWFNFSPVSATIPFTDNNSNTAIQNFCMTANGVHNDVEVVIAPITPARPGFDAVYQITSRNKGNQTISGNIAFVYNDAILHYVSSTILPISQSSNVLVFDYTNLLPFESRSFTITLHVNSPTDTPPVNIGDLLNFTATINPVTGDENIDDNQILYTQTVVGSFDPNDITCIEGDVVSPSQIGKYLHYIINFENTGTAPAENIVVKDIIDAAKYDISSLQVMNSSHPVTARLTGNVAEFIFQTINLDSGGHGNILLKVKSKNNLLEGDTVTKKADIFFDYNAPISTNIANTIFQSLSNPNFEVDNTIRVFPNPTKNTINIQSKNNIKSIELYDAQGRILQTSIVEDVSKTLDITERQTGIYYLKITSDKGMKVEKVVKE